MKENLERALDFLFFAECGGKSEPKWKHEVAGDPGGLTIYGVAKNRWPKDVALMEKMSKEDARAYAIEFYRKNFWTPLECDLLPYGMDIVVFDIGVNQGAAKAKEILIAAANWQDALILRADKWDDLQTLFKKFGAGWSKRMVSLRDYIASVFTVLEWDRSDLIPSVIKSKEEATVMSETKAEETPVEKPKLGIIEAIKLIFAAMGGIDAWKKEGDKPVWFRQRTWAKLIPVVAAILPVVTGYQIDPEKIMQTIESVNLLMSHVTHIWQHLSEDVWPIILTVSALWGIKLNSKGLRDAIKRGEVVK